jgi:hypothetical protein
MAAKEMNFMKKKGAPASMIKHEKAEAKGKPFAKGGGISSSLKAHASAPASKAHAGMKAGGAVYRKAADGLAKKGKTIPIGQAQPGDIVFFQFDEDAQPDHVGIVVKNDGKKFLWCIEGNTSGDKRGSQANGDGVYRKKRAYSLVMAVVRP